jgi:hypothetical protein
MNRTERMRLISAIGSILSVAIGLLSVSLDLLWDSEGYSTQSLFLLNIAVLIAAVSAVMMITVARRKKREGKGRIFLVYAKEDQEKIEKLYNELQAAGFNPWMDSKDLLPGQRWQYAIKNAIEESDAALVFLSKNSTEKKGYVQKELDLALSLIEDRNGGISPVIPVRLEETNVPTKLKNLQWLDLFREGSFDKLILTLKMAVSVS